MRGFKSLLLRQNPKSLISKTSGFFFFPTLIFCSIFLPGASPLFDLPRCRLCLYWRHRKGGFFHGFLEKTSASPAALPGAALFLYCGYTGPFSQCVPQRAGTQPGPVQYLPQPVSQ
ncbi:hypothetical protein BACCAP_02672 [Pseudoflavonifractor capillosus ATCC 29799]|uniref:Uncharacterized protein n=1 Tax=Pseudoflavonifractor capillosus ATCC 29799 TaxID=411467 RepID=A6NWS8_9FIRM|nr:hypothetical protein BACCAP_02672 [Pseudoflavonifractor capillosus ATCC 29799]